MENSLVLLFQIWLSDSGGYVVFKLFYFRCGGRFIEPRETVSAFVRGPNEEHICEIILNLCQWFRWRCQYVSILALVAI